MDVLTEGEVARMAIATLRHLAVAITDRYTSARTVQATVLTEGHYASALREHQYSKQPLSDSARLAWLELDEDCRDLIAQRTENPDSMLRWLDAYPKTVLTVILSPKTAEKSLKPAKTH